MENDNQTTTTGQTWPWPGVIAVAAVLVAAVGWAYAPNLKEMAWRWNNDPNYSYGYFVVPIALFILWHRRDRLENVRIRPTGIGLLVLAGVLGLRSYLYQVNEQWLEMATLPLAVAAVMLSLGGWRFLTWSLPAVAFLYLMLPMPWRFNNLLASHLQGLATIISTAIMQALSLPALAEGNIIYVGTERLEVARACSGLSMLLTFVTLIAAVILLTDLSRWEKIVLALCAIPIAVVSNVIRIVATGWAYYQFGPTKEVLPGWTINRLTHDPAGWAMMPVALVLVWLVLRLLSWLVIEEEPEAKPTLVLPPTGPTPIPKKS